MNQSQIDILVEQLKAADDVYYNDPDGATIMSDSEYDELKRTLVMVDPSNPYLNAVGAPVRVGSKEVELPQTMGSLDQLYTQDDINEWLSTTKDSYYLITSKLDGISCLLVYNNGLLTNAYKRGDGYNGADITPNVKQMCILPLTIPATSKKTFIRAELIMNKQTFESKYASMYKTPRSLVSGVMGRLTPRDDINDIDAVAYEIMSVDDCNKTTMIETLMGMGFKVPNYTILHRSEVNTEILTTWIEQDVKHYEYEVDGVVIDSNTSSIRHALHSANLNPTFAKKYKILSEANIKTTTVQDIILRPSQYGYIKPRIKTDAVELFGNTVTHFSGFNMGAIYAKRVGPGAIVQVTKSGGTIPFVMNVISPSTVEDYDDWFNSSVSQFGDWDWTESGADIIITSGSEEANIRMCARFFTTLQIAQLAYGNARKLYNAGYTTPLMILAATRDELVNVIGENGNVINQAIQERMKTVTIPELMGALAVFGRGMGTTRCELLCEAIGTDASKYTAALIELVPKFGDVYPAQIMERVPAWLEWFEGFNCFYSISEERLVQSGSNEFLAKNIVFTGFRNKNLEAAIKANGGKLQSSVSSSTDLVVCIDPNENSGKLKTAKSKGIQIMTLPEFQKMI